MAMMSDELFKKIYTPELLELMTKELVCSGALSMLSVPVSRRIRLHNTFFLPWHPLLVEARMRRRRRRAKR